MDQRIKNAIRQHLIQEYKPGESYEEESWLPLARYIETAEPDSDETVEDEGFYDGDGTPERNVHSVAMGYSFTGYKDATNPAQALIIDMEFETGLARKVWFRRISSDGKVQHTGLATVSEIINGGGDATSYEEFECNIRWDQKPLKEKLEPGTLTE